MVVAATGFFDGVHAGHRAVLQVLKDTAREEGEESAVITFWPHPRNVLRQDASSMRKYLVEQFHVDTIVIGYDHRLGRSSTASREELAAIASTVGLRTRIVEEVHCEDRKVSSTQIRNLLAAGDVQAAAQLLGYRYSLSGAVVSGNMLGRTMGFPTANMQLSEPLKMVPADGVYAVSVDVGGGRHGGICNIGTRPTVTEANVRTIETNIFDFSENIYGLDIRIGFVARIRDEHRFASLDDLRLQMEHDRKIAEKMLSRLVRYYSGNSVYSGTGSAGERQQEEKARTET